MAATGKAVGKRDVRTPAPVRSVSRPFARGVPHERELGAVEYAEACAVLGVRPGTTAEEAREAYRLRARMLHPDKHVHAAVDVQAEAQRAMQQVNEAWAVMQGGVPSQRAASPERPTARPPGPGECDLCGSQPAAPVAFRRLTGLVIMYRVDGIDVTACRSCGTNLFRESQASTLCRGWWGLIAVFRTLLVLWKNGSQLRRLRRVSMPQRRAPDLITPLPFPMPLVRPVLKRPGPWVATLGAFFVAFALAGAALESEASSGGGESPRDAVGSCLDTGGSLVACSDPAMKAKIMDYVSTPSGCAPTHNFLEIREDYGGGFCLLVF